MVRCGNFTLTQKMSSRIFLFSCNTSIVNLHCDRYYDRIGIEHKGFHTYRHTFGTNLCRNGIPIQTASALLGHEDISVTAKYYVNVGLDQKQEAVDSLVGILKS